MSRVDPVSYTLIVLELWLHFADDVPESFRLGRLLLTSYVGGPAINSTI